jgi:integrase/recombinase XerD
MKKPIASLYHDTRYDLNDHPGTYPVAIQFYFDRKRVFVGTGIILTPEDFEIVSKGSPRVKELKAIKAQLEKAIHKANTIIDELKGKFTLTRAKNLFFDTNYQTDKNSVYTAFDAYIKSLEINGQIKTSDSYKTAKNSLQSFETVLTFSQITPEFLERYEDWLVSENGKSITTLGIYLRNLRTIINRALDAELIFQKSYPFGKGKYVIPTGRNVKKALTIDHIRAIRDYFTVPGSPSDRAKDFFLFSYLSNGINFKDIAKLKNENIKGDQIHFVRAKTIRTRRDYTPIKTSLRAETLEIIEKWRNPDRSPQAYLFTVLSKGLTAKQETRRVQDFVKNTNSKLISIGEALKLPLKLTTYVARHSFATIAINKGGAPIEYISEALGHSTLNTTRNYIDSFEDKRIKQITDSLL